MSRSRPRSRSRGGAGGSRARPLAGDLRPIREEIAIVGDVGSHALEELRLALRRLARRHGVELDVQIETEEDSPGRRRHRATSGAGARTEQP